MWTQNAIDIALCRQGVLTTRGNLKPDPLAPHTLMPGETLMCFSTTLARLVLVLQRHHTRT